MPLGEMHSGDAVLKPRQVLVSDVLVEGHPAGERAVGEHSGAEDHVRPALEDRRDELGQQLWCVLTVAVQENSDVEAVVDQPAVAEFLVAAVAEVPALPDHRDRQAPVLALVGDTDLVRVVGGEIVADEDDLDRRPERLRDAFEHRHEGCDCVIRDDEDADPHLTLPRPGPRTRISSLGRHTSTGPATPARTRQAEMRYAQGSSGPGAGEAARRATICGPPGTSTRTPGAGGGPVRSTSS